MQLDHNVPLVPISQTLRRVGSCAASVAFSRCLRLWRHRPSSKTMGRGNIVVPAVGYVPKTACTRPVFPRCCARSQSFERLQAAISRWLTSPPMCVRCSHSPCTLAVALAYEACIQLSNGLHKVMRANCSFAYGANPPHFSLHC